MPRVCRGCNIPRCSLFGGARCPGFAGDAIFPGVVYLEVLAAQGLQGMQYSPVKFIWRCQMPRVCRGCNIPRCSLFGGTCCPGFTGDA